jgi:hypothetical protein
VRIFPSADVVAYPFVIEANAAVGRAGAVAAHFAVRSRSAVISDPLHERRVEQENRVGSREILATIGVDRIAARPIEDAVVLKIVFAPRRPNRGRASPSKSWSARAYNLSPKVSGNVGQRIRV